MEIARHWRLRQQRYGLRRDWAIEFGDMDQGQIDEFLLRLSLTELTWAQWAEGSLDLVNHLYNLQHPEDLSSLVPQKQFEAKNTEMVVVE